MLLLLARVDLGAMAMKGHSTFSKLKHCWNLTISLFSFISTSFVKEGVVLSLCSNAVNVSYNSSRLGNHFLLIRLMWRLSPFSLKIRTLIYQSSHTDSCFLLPSPNHVARIQLGQLYLRKALDQLRFLYPSEFWQDIICFLRFFLLWVKPFSFAGSIYVRSTNLGRL